MSRIASLLAVPVLLGACESQGERQQVAVSCRAGDPGFTLSEGARVKGAPLLALFRGATVVQVRQGPDASLYYRYTRAFRGDGSVETRYEGGPGPDGPWRAADGVVSGDAHAGSRDNGIWSAEADRLCVQNNMTGDRACYAVYAAGGRYAWRNLDGPSCGDGPFAIVARNR